MVDYHEKAILKKKTQHEPEYYFSSWGEGLHGTDGHIRIRHYSEF